MAEGTVYLHAAAGGNVTSVTSGAPFDSERTCWQRQMGGGRYGVGQNYGTQYLICNVLFARSAHSPISHFRVKFLIRLTLGVLI